MKNKSLYWVLSCALFLTACARDNMKMSPECLDKPSSIVIGQASGLEKPRYYKVGETGIIDDLVNDALGAEMETIIQNIDVRSLVENHYTQPFSQAFKNRSFTVLNTDIMLKKETLSKSEESDKKFAPYNFKFLKAQHQADYALLLIPHAFGMQRHYYGFIPLSQPYGYVSLEVYLVKTTDNSVAGYYRTAINMPVQGEWDSPPDYQETVEAVKNALIKGLQEAYTYFFE